MDADGHERVECGGDDCDDDDASRFPGNVEVCDGDDEDCNDATFGDRDADGDGVISAACCNGANCGTDCDDGDRQIGGIFEPCDGQDNDCDGAIDEASDPLDWYLDRDADGFGDPTSVPVASCDPVSMRSRLATDCDDNDPQVNRTAQERCNGRDDDCDGAVDEGCADAGPVDAGLLDAGVLDAGPVCAPAVYGTTNYGGACYQ